MIDRPQFQIWHNYFKCPVIKWRAQIVLQTNCNHRFISFVAIKCNDVETSSFIKLLHKRSAFYDQSVHYFILIAHIHTFTPWGNFESQVHLLAGF